MSAAGPALAGLRAALERRLPRRAEARRGGSRFAALRRAVSGVGVRERTGEDDAWGRDADRVADLAPLLDALAARCWTVERRDGPAVGPALFVANRAGPPGWDAIFGMHLLAREIEVSGPRGVRALVDARTAGQPFVFPQLVRLGVLRASRANAERLLREGWSVLVCPERSPGAAGAPSGPPPGAFGRGGIAFTAAAAGRPVIPVAIARPGVRSGSTRWRLAVGTPRAVATKGLDGAAATALCETLRREVCAMLRPAEGRRV